MLAILTTHPIQYQVPLWQELARDNTVPFEVWYLTNHGTQVSYDAQFGKSFAWDINTLEGYPYRYIEVNKDHKVNKFWKLRLTSSFTRLLKEKKVTTLWIQGWQVAAYWQAAWQAHRLGIPVWIRGESNDLKPINPWKEPLKKIVIEQLFKRIKYFLYIGQANKRLYKRYGIEDSQLYCGGYCVDNKRFVEQAGILKSERANIRKTWNIPEHALCILFAGKFIPKKRPLDIVEAVANIDIAKKNNTGIHILFVGSGELGDLLRQHTNVVYDSEYVERNSALNTTETKLQLPAVSFAGFLNQTQISKAYAAADCLILPSDTGETWGLVVNEAMASGLPAIVSDQVGCAEDLVIAGETGYMYECGNINQLSAIIVKLVENREQIQQMGANARQRIQNWSFASVIDSVKKMYRPLVSETVL